MFIHSRVTLEIPIRGANKYRIDNEYIGPVPDAVAEHWLFKAAVADNKITFVGDSPRATNAYDPEAEAAAELEKYRVQAAKLMIDGYEDMDLDELRDDVAEATAEYARLKKEGKALKIPNYNKMNPVELSQAVADAKKAAGVAEGEQGSSAE